LKAQGEVNSQRWAEMRMAKRWLHRDIEKIPTDLRALVEKAKSQSEILTELVAMREELRQLWTKTNVSADQLVVDLQAWCKKAEDSGIAALQRFALQLKSVQHS
jgi:stearoyl-CoA desaturase (delta-9 desaturase)